jgi:hypothetical protein
VAHHLRNVLACVKRYAKMVADMSSLHSRAMSVEPECSMR